MRHRIQDRNQKLSISMLAFHLLAEAFQPQEMELELHQNIHLGSNCCTFLRMHTCVRVFGLVEVVGVVVMGGAAQRTWSLHPPDFAATRHGVWHSELPCPMGAKVYTDKVFWCKIDFDREPMWTLITAQQKLFPDWTQYCSCQVTQSYTGGQQIACTKLNQAVATDSKCTTK